MRESVAKACDLEAAELFDGRRLGALMVTVEWMEDYSAELRGR